MGSDLTVVNAARVSFDKESEWEVKDGEFELNDWMKLSEQDTKLIGYLARNGHWTPFGHPQITLRETVPIFVARQRFKHTVGFLYNEISRRYVDDDPQFYTPSKWRKRAENVKQGSSDQIVPKIEEVVVNWDYDSFGYDEVIHLCELWYKKAIENGYAPEQARMVLPQSMYTSYYVTGSLSAFARAYNLRSDAHAQLEIQELAAQWGRIISLLFPTSWSALTASGKS